MKKDNPLSQAVRSRVRPQEKKTIMVPAADVPRGMSKGAAIRITGTIESIDESNATVSVTSIENEAEEKEAPVMRVVTQESHA